MRAWEQVLVRPVTTLRQALVTIDKAGSQIALVVDENRRLLGTLSDGDARRALLRGLSLDDPVSAAMHTAPRFARVGEDTRTVLATMRASGLHQIPMLDAEGAVIGLITIGDYLVQAARNHWVVIMAGGQGTRLQQLTRDTPKPMLRIGSRPLLETIVRSYAEQGFRRFYIAVNYKAEQIEGHFGDGTQLDVEICYLRERMRLGTAGALSLLPEAPSLPIIVTNGDLLTKEDYGRMIEQHEASAADATMAVRDYEVQVPFGVVNERDGSIASIEEKPIKRFVVSAGMYVLSPQVLPLVPHETPYDMPALFEAMVESGMRTRCHHIDGYWLDIGRITDYEQANADFPGLFQ